MVSDSSTKPGLTASMDIRMLYPSPAVCLGYVHTYTILQSCCVLGVRTYVRMLYHNHPVCLGYIHTYAVSQSCRVLRVPMYIEVMISGELC